MHEAVGVLVPELSGDPGSPSDRPIGRAALRLRAEGIAVIFGIRAEDGALIGHRALPDRWEPARASVCAAWDRFPSQSAPGPHAALLDGLGATPVQNSDALVRLCRDKLHTADALHGLPQPEVEADPARFAEALERWGSGYLKPRFGAFGRGIRRVLPGDPLPSEGEGAVPGQREPLFLQRAVPPIEGWRGLVCRVLVQATPDGWWIGPAVARRSRTDWVVNAARGSEVVPLERDLPQLVGAVDALARAVAERLAADPRGAGLVELGVDIGIARDHSLWVFEVNSRPRGRLEVLAGADPQRFAEAHVEACCRPIRTLAARHG